MKKLILFLMILFVLPTANIFASSSAENVNESIIENGLTVFTLEDYSNPFVRVEVNVRAGFSLQNVQNAGFFKLLSSLIEKSAKTKFDSVECGSDSTRFILNVSPSALGNLFLNLSDDIFNPIFSDSLLKQELSLMKREVLQNSTDPSYLINSSIDARVFADEPWKHDTGIYPSLFSTITEASARTLLNEILENFYIPQNTAIFVSGNIHSAEIIKLIEGSFGKYYSNKKLKFIPLKTASGDVKKFVVHDKQFSEELTQLVVQYVSFKHSEAELAASIFNNDKSQFKQGVSSVSDLNILASEYIDVSAAYKSGCTRLIFQSLMQSDENKNPAEQTVKFLDALKQNSSIPEGERESAALKNDFSYKKIISTSSNFMEVLSNFWALRPYSSFSAYDFPENYRSVVSYEMESWNENLNSVNLSSLFDTINSESPFVFVIMNTKQYGKYKSDFDSEGFEEVTIKNGSWYTQSLYKNIQSYKDFQAAETKSKKSDANFSGNFYASNRDSISSVTLENGVNLCVKENPNTTGVTFIIAIEGGHLRSADDHGFEEVMINILTTNMLRQIEQKRRQMQIVNDYEIFSETKLDYSRIVVECDVNDFLPILNACMDALIFDDVKPTDADMVVQNRRTRKRLENGSTINQLYYAAIKELFPNSDYTKIFETKNEILENTTYEKILQNYPQLLNASRFSFVVSGNISADEVQAQIEEVFSVLQLHSNFVSANKNTVSSRRTDFESLPVIEFPYGKMQKVRLNHVFLTDVSAKNAGPMPQKLIPTKNFSDPILYCIKSPEFGSDDYFIFNSVLPYIQTEMNNFIDGRNDLYNCTISAARATAFIPMATLTFSSVGRTSAADNVYKTVLNSLKEDLSRTLTSGKTLQKIKDTFIAWEFQDALTNTGSAILIDNGIHDMLNNDSAASYLESYLRINNITAEEILNALEKYFSFDNLYRLYSADSRK